MSLIEIRTDRVKQRLRYGAHGWAVVGLEGPVSLWSDEDEAIIAASELNDISEKHQVSCPYWTEWRGFAPDDTVDVDENRRGE